MSFLNLQKEKFSLGRSLQMEKILGRKYVFLFLIVSGGKIKSSKIQIEKSKKYSNKNSKIKDPFP